MSDSLSTMSRFFELTQSRTIHDNLNLGCSVAICVQAASVALTGLHEPTSKL